MSNRPPSIRANVDRKFYEQWAHEREQMIIRDICNVEYFEKPKRAKVFSFTNCYVYGALTDTNGEIHYIYTNPTHNAEMDMAHTDKVKFYE